MVTDAKEAKAIAEIMNPPDNTSAKIKFDWNPPPKKKQHAFCVFCNVNYRISFTRFSFCAAINYGKYNQ